MATGCGRNLAVYHNCVAGGRPCFGVQANAGGSLKRLIFAPDISPTIGDCLTPAVPAGTGETESGAIS